MITSLARFFYIISISLVHFSSGNKFENNSDTFASHNSDGIATTQSSGIVYVATTPKIDFTTKNLSRCEIFHYF